MMKPKALTEHDEGMLEFLEDIIGSSRFKEPIDILSKRVEELNERRAEKVGSCSSVQRTQCFWPQHLRFFRHTTFSVICFQLNRVKAVEKEKDDLEPVRNEAIEFLTMENDIVKKKNLLYQKYQ